MDGQHAKVCIFAGTLFRRRLLMRCRLRKLQGLRTLFIQRIQEPVECPRMMGEDESTLLMADIKAL